MGELGYPADPHHLDTRRTQGQPKLLRSANRRELSRRPIGEALCARFSSQRLGVTDPNTGAPEHAVA